MNPRVTAVEPRDGLRLRLSFLDGRVVVFDAAPLLHYPVYQYLRDPKLFASARLSHGTVEWPGGLDIDPDTRYLESH